MTINYLILLMGSEAGGLYQIAQAFQRMGLPCRTPVATLREPLASRRLPAHHYLWYWNAIRRFYEDLSLPPIAQVPFDRISPEEFEYYSRLFARSLGSYLIEKSFICADHLTAFILPFLLHGMAKKGTPVEMIYCFSHPGYEAAMLRQKFGQAPALSEFVWRNSAVSAILTGGKNIHFYEWGEDNIEAWYKLADGVLEFFPELQLSISKREAWQLQERLRLPESMHLSEATMQLYSALHEYVKKNLDWYELKAVALKLHALQVEQNGWQYVNCLDSDALHNQAKRLMNQKEYPETSDCSQISKENISGYNFPGDQAGWALLLDEAERKLLLARQNFERELFLQCDSLHRFYLHCMSDERKLAYNAKIEEELKRRKRRIRHHKRLRVLWQLKNEKAVQK